MGEFRENGVKKAPPAGIEPAFSDSKSGAQIPVLWFLNNPKFILCCYCSASLKSATAR